METPEDKPEDNNKSTTPFKRTRLLAPCNVIRKKNQQTANSSWIQTGFLAKQSACNDDAGQAQSEKRDVSGKPDDRQTRPGNRRAVSGSNARGGPLYGRCTEIESTYDAKY